MVSHRIDTAEKARLTTEMAEFFRDNEPCTRDDLLRQFSKNEIDMCHDAAREMALSDQRRVA
jgi:hypothetical protein